MKFNILTIFPDYFNSPLKTSLLGKALDRGLLEIDIIDIRKFSRDKHHSVDDTPYGGGAGMVMMVQPIYDAVMSIKSQEKTYVLLTTPRGRVFNQRFAVELAQKNSITIICGRYEGVDERVAELVVDEEVSLGNFVTFGGEVAALAIVEAVARLLPGVVGKPASVEQESFSTEFTIEYPHYTRPAEFMGLRVPEVLLSGNHKEIAKWREEKAKEMTEKWRKRNADNSI